MATACVSVNTRGSAIPDLHRPPASRSRWALVLLLASLTIACEDSTGSPPCNASAVGNVSVSPGLTPTITWDAACRANALVVYPTISGIPVWELSAHTRSIPKPVTYGVVPTGVTELHTAEVLHSGAEYGVLVTIVAGIDTLATIATFTP